MAATGKTPILLYGSTTATNQPSAGNLTNSSDGCEIAINVADKNLFFKDSTNTVNTVPVRQSSASSDGWLSSTDWSTFNSKQPAGTYVTSVTGTAPVVSSGGTTPAISMAAATSSVNGYLTSTDWTTFNNKVSSQWVTSGSNIYYTAGSVGIGNTSPVAALDVNFGLASTASPITYLSAANANDSTAVEIRQGRYNKDALVITSNQTLSANFIRVSENGTDRFIVAGGGVGNVTVSTGNLVIGTSGKGIDFSATSGTGTSELLADYEEGTWTPAFVSGTFGYTFQSGFYTKVGRLVTATGLIAWNSKSSSGNLSITLPYTITNTNYYRGGISFGNCSGIILNAGYAVIGSLDQNSTATDMYFNVSNAGAQRMTLNDVASSGAIQFTATFFV